LVDGERQARLRNLLVHLYLEIDDRRVFASLERLQDLREFAAASAAGRRAGPVAAVADPDQ